MAGYVRPAMPRTVHRDAAGALIDYGHRWGVRPAPVESYSVVTHGERFAPLHTVADALIAALIGGYDVVVSRDRSHAADLLRTPERNVAATRLTPRAPDAASLTFVHTAFPGVLVHAGVLHDFRYPNCGCDACDETAETQADGMERLTFAVVTGRYREQVRHGRRIGYAVFDETGGETESGWRESGDIDPERLAAARQRLGRLTDRWAPWPTRGTG